MDHRAFVVILTFVVAITPSLTDMVQVNDDHPGSYKYVLLWYFILFIVLISLWEQL